MSDEFNKILNDQKEKDAKKISWIEKKILDQLPKEEDLKDISKAMLAHNIVCLKDELDEIKKERDLIAKENERLTEENSNLEILLQK